MKLQPAPVLLMSLHVAMERVSMTVQNVMVAMTVLMDQMSWSVPQVCFLLCFCFLMFCYGYMRSCASKGVLRLYIY